MVHPFAKNLLHHQIPLAAPRRRSGLIEVVQSLADNAASKKGPVQLAWHPLQSMRC